MSRSIFIAARFCGPPDSGNGGYTCGLVSAALGAPADVTLRKPIPIERELSVHVQGQGVLLKDADVLIAEGVPAAWSLQPPADTFDFQTASAAAKNSPAFKDHPFPTCFVCGPDRAPGDGLRIFPGRVESNGAKYFAAPWIPDAALADSRGQVRDEFVWAALDCPTGFAGGFPWDGTLVTGRLGARLVSPVHAGEKCVLLSWATGVEGRKHFADCVLLGEDGSLRAESRATWIKLA